MQLEGTAFPPRSSQRCEARLDLSDPIEARLTASGHQPIYATYENVQRSKPVANLPVRFQFANGWVFVCEWTPELDVWLQQNNPSRLLGRMESSKLAWLTSVSVILLCGVWAYWYLLPWTSEKVAQHLPVSLEIALGEAILEQFDNHSFTTSELPIAEQERIRRRVASFSAQLPSLPFEPQIHFRRSNMGANAFALPGGNIVLLDGLVALANNEQQLDSIILHEFAHVHHRHMTERMVHSALLAVVVAMITGESSGVLDTLTSVGVLVLSNGLSREAEMEADAFAQQAMLDIYGSSEPMAEMFELLQQQTHEASLPEWLNSHPDLERRIEFARGE